jgi:hypothetical protein|nr:MAG: hypothetical protein DIU62_11125 [Pseudomonadota bacterium]
MRRLILSVLALLGVCSATAAEDLLRHADPDVLNGLIFGGRAAQRARVTDTIPADLADVQVPKGFVLIGTAERGDGMVTTAFATGIELEPAFDALLQALLAAGWQTEMQPAQAPTFTVATDGRSEAVQLVCRDSRRRIVTAREFEGVRHVSTATIPGQAARPCHARDSAPGFGSLAQLQALQSQMPRITFPDGVKITGPGGGGGGGDAIHQSVRVSSPEETLTSLLLDLSRQLTAQGWRRDATWNGQIAAGAVWTRTSRDGVALMVLLEIIDAGDSQFDVRFLLMPAGA